MKNVTILTIPLSQVNGDYSDIWIGIPNYQTSIYVGLQRPDGSIWEGLSQYNKDRNWPDFINAWYVANICLKTLDKCVGKIAVSSLLPGCASVFVINKSDDQLDDNILVFNFLPHKQKDVDDLLLQLPPLDYIENIVSLAKEEHLLLDSSVLRVFLKKYEQVPSSLLEQLEEYEGGRNVLVQNS